MRSSPKTARLFEVNLPAYLEIRVHDLNVFEPFINFRRKLLLNLCFSGMKIGPKKSPTTLSLSLNFGSVCERLSLKKPPTNG